MLRRGRAALEGRRPVALLGHAASLARAAPLGELPRRGGPPPTLARGGLRLGAPGRGEGSGGFGRGILRGRQGIPRALPLRRRVLLDERRLREDRGRGPGLPLLPRVPVGGVPDRRPREARDSRRFADPDFSLDEAASRAGVSPNHLSFEFSREAGETFTSYLTRVRMEEAKRLLASTDLMVYEIGELVGYPSVEHFSRSFKRLVGASPARYKAIVSDDDRPRGGGPRLCPYKKSIHRRKHHSPFGESA